MTGVDCCAKVTIHLPVVHRGLESHFLFFFESSPESIVRLGSEAVHLLPASTGLGARHFPFGPYISNLFLSSLTLLTIPHKQRFSSRQRSRKACAYEALELRFRQQLGLNVW